MNPLKLENQLCFPLYATARAVVKKYTPYLEKIGLTYTQYITMMVMWERSQVSVKELGAALYLDSGTLTPLLKKLEAHGFVTRNRSDIDERELVVSITDKGRELRHEALFVPAKMGECITITGEEAAELYRILYKLLGDL